MANQKTLGTLYILTLAEQSDFSDEVNFACSTSDSFEPTSDTVEADCKESGIYAEPLPVKINTTMTQEGLLVIDDTNQEWLSQKIHGWQQNSTKLYFKLGPTAVGENRINGQCYVTGAPLTLPNKDNATFTMTLSVTGSWSYVPVPTP